MVKLATDLANFVEFAAQKALHWSPPNISDTSLRSINSPTTPPFNPIQYCLWYCLKRL